MKYFLISFFVFFKLLFIGEQVNAQDNSIREIINAQNYQKAIDVILLNGDVENLDKTLLENLGYCYIMTREYNKAEDIYAKLIATKKPTAENLKYYAEILFANKKYEKAKDNFIRFRELNLLDKQIQLKIASCDSLISWNTQDPQFLIKPFSATNNQSDVMSSVSISSTPVFLSNGNNQVIPIDSLKNEVSSPYVLNDFNVSNINLFDSKTPENVVARINNSRLAEKYWCTSFSYSKERNVHAFALKEIHRNMHEFSLGKSLIMFDGGVNEPVNNLVAFKWEGMPSGINISQPGFAKNGLRLYFSSDMPGGFGGMDLYYSDLGNNAWTTPKNLGENINTAFDELSPAISGDTLLYYSSNGLPGYGNFDVYCSIINNDSFEKSVNMKAPINSSGNEIYFQPNIGKSALFKSNRSSMGKEAYDVYVAYPKISDDPKIDSLIQPVTKRVFDIENYNQPFVLFEINEAIVDTNYDQSLEALADSLKLFNDLHVEVLGYTDTLGTTDFNNQLSVARAKAVADKLLSFGAPESQISYKGKGVTKNGTIQGIRYTIILKTLKSPDYKEYFSKKMKGKYDIIVLPNGKTFSYCIGDFDNMQEAENFLKEINSGHRSRAHVGAFYFGKCLTKYNASINRRVDLILSKSE